MPLPLQSTNNATTGHHSQGLPFPGYYAGIFDHTLTDSKNQNGAITLAAHRHSISVPLNNSTLLIFAVLVV